MHAYMSQACDQNHLQSRKWQLTGMS